MLGKGGAKPAAAAAAATTTTTTTTAEPMETEEVGDVPEPPELLLVRKALDIALQPGATEMLGVVEMPIRLAYANAVHEEAVTQAVADPVHLSVSANDRKHVCPQAHTYEHGEDRPCNGSMMLARATAAVCCILDTEGMAGQWDAFYRELGLDRIGSIRELIEGPKGEMGEATSASGDRVWLMHLAVLLGVMDVILPHAPGLERFERVEKVHAFLSASWSAFEAATDLIAASRAACGAIFGDL
jgi:hypothetical protein